MSDDPHRGGADAPPAAPRRKAPNRATAARRSSVAAQWKPVGSYGTIGLEVVLCMMVGLFGGGWLDGRLGTAPYLAVVGFVFGVAAGGKAIWRGWKDMQAETAREEREQGNPEPLPDPELDESRASGHPEGAAGDDGPGRGLVSDAPGSSPRKPPDADP